MPERDCVLENPGRTGRTNVLYSCFAGLAYRANPLRTLDVVHRMPEIPNLPSKMWRGYETNEAMSSTGTKLEGDLWVAAMAQELDFFLSALPDHDDLPAKFTEILCGFLEKAKKESRESGPAKPWDVAGGQSDLTDVQRAGIFNLTGVCLRHLGNSQRAASTLDLLVSHATELGSSSRRAGGAQDRGYSRTHKKIARTGGFGVVSLGDYGAFARGLGVCASRHLELTLTAIAKAAKPDSTRRGLQSFFAKSSAVQTAEQLRATLLLSLGFCAINTPGPMLLQDKACERILKPLHQAGRTGALLQEKSRDILRHTVDAVQLVGEAYRCPQERRMGCDPFLTDTAEASKTGEEALEQKGQEQPDSLVEEVHEPDGWEALANLSDLDDDDNDGMVAEEPPAAQPHPFFNDEIPESQISEADRASIDGALARAAAPKTPSLLKVWDGIVIDDTTPSPPKQQSVDTAQGRYEHFKSLLDAVQQRYDQVQQETPLGKFGKLF
eukprot:symbB.v1.2.017159.t1/scaffold1332.1/size124990/3